MNLKTFKYLTYIFLAVIVYPVLAVFFLVKVIGLFIYRGAEEVVSYTQNILSTLENAAK